MDIKQTKRTLKGLPPRHSVLLRGRHGIGKSQIIAQTAAELSQSTGRPHQFIDIRLSQREVGDIIGLPRSVNNYPFTRSVFKNGEKVSEETVLNNVMIHDLPAWFPTDPDSCGILFLDEIDRAPREVQQAGFELVLDYRLNLRDLPKGWRVVAAANADQDVYAVINMDPALLDRFQVIDLRPKVPEWQEHARNIGVHDAVCKYISKFSSDLFTPENIESGNIYPSPRAWVLLSDSIKYMAENGDDPLKDLDYLTLLATGYVGSTVSINFVEYIKKDYRVLSATDILNKYNPDMNEEFQKMLATEVAFYNKVIVDYIKDEKVRLSPKQQANLFKYYQVIPKEQASGFWSYFSNQARDEATRWYKSAPKIADYTMSFLGKSSALK